MIPFVLLFAGIIAIYAVIYALSALCALCVLVYTAFGGTYRKTDGTVMHMPDHVRYNIALPLIRCVFAGLALVALLVAIF